MTIKKDEDKFKAQTQRVLRREIVQEDDGVGQAVKRVNARRSWWTKDEKRGE